MMLESLFNKKLVLSRDLMPQINIVFSPKKATMLASSSELFVLFLCLLVVLVKGLVLLSQKDQKQAPQSSPPVLLPQKHPEPSPEEKAQLGILRNHKNV